MLLLVRIFNYFNNNFEGVVDVKPEIYNDIKACLGDKVYDATFLIIKKVRRGAVRIFTDFLGQKEVTGDNLKNLKSILSTNHYL